MFNPNFFERLKHKLVSKVQKYCAPMKRRYLNNTDFTIISNNCWGGGNVRRIWFTKTKSNSRMLFIC